MNRSRIQSFLVGAVAGVAIWALSPVLTGQTEPWDADGLYYFVALIVGGFLSGLAVPTPVWMLYVGSVLGQFVYAALVLPSSPLLVVGLVFLLLWSLLFLGGAYAGSRLRLNVGGRPPAA